MGWSSVPAAGGGGGGGVEGTWIGAWAASDGDTVNEPISFPFDGAEIKSILVGAVGTAPTAGTISLKKGLDASGAEMIDSGPWALSGLTDDTIAEMTLTGTLADLQGGRTTGITISVNGADGDIIVIVEFGEQ